MTTPAPLSPRQRDTLAAITTHHARHGHAPTTRELAAALGLSPHSVQAVTGHLNALRRKGWLTWEPHLSRTLRVLHSLTDVSERSPGAAASSPPHAPAPSPMQTGRAAAAGAAAPPPPALPLEAAPPTPPRHPRARRSVAAAGR